MTDDPIRSHVLSVRVIPRLSEDIKRQLSLPEGHTSIGIFTADSDDVAYTALDEATKKASVCAV